MPATAESLSYGARIAGDRAEFRVWAPRAKNLTLRLLSAASQDTPMQRDQEGVFSVTAPAQPGDRYFYLLDGHSPVPDPVSRFLPEGVHGPTEIVAPDAFPWSDHDWRGLELRDYIMYELHVGTFTPQGTFEAIIERLEYLKSAGVSVIELMPVAAFPGRRNWGYDGVSPYAVQASYGGPDGLKRLVNAAHRTGMGVVLDVVYNHFGPEGNYLPLFGPYLTDRHRTPWGQAVNYDGPDSNYVRRYVVENALYWIREYHLDGLRLDAIQTIKDDSPTHILAEIQSNVQQLGHELDRKVCVIGETDENDTRYVLPRRGGMGLNAIWSDDFHHSVHVLLTGERQGYYQDFGSKEQVVRALNEGFVFQGELFQFWKRPRGTPVDGVPLPAHVICTQNHDQVGNRALGERLDVLVPRGASKLAAALLLLAPHTPLLLMGQEYGETAPFQYFTDFSDPQLQKAVSEGRRNEFREFGWSAEEVPDPQDPATFERSKLRWPVSGQWSVASDQSSRTADMLDWYRKLMALRRQSVIPGERTCSAHLVDGTITVHVPAQNPKIIILAEFPDSHPQPGPKNWQLAMSSDQDGYRVRVFTEHPMQ